MPRRISRREFLKIAGLVPMAYSMPRLVEPSRPLEDPNAQNVIVIVFDTLSAHHIQLYGYDRETMPNLARLVDRATVYHNHYASGSFTTPGTASLLTGTHPWTHRAFVSGKPTADRFVSQNLFQAFDQYYRLSYTHNPMVNTFLNQFSGDLDLYKPRRDLFLRPNDWFPKLFNNDEDIATVSWVQIIKKKFGGDSYSLFLSGLYQNHAQQIAAQYGKDFPRGVPYISQDSFYLLEHAIDWTNEQLKITPQPFMGYFHYLPPHKPYATKKEYTDVFLGDGYQPIIKPYHRLERGGYTDIAMARQRRWYDEFILYADHEFSRLYTSLEQAGLLDNTWLVFTSDHGEIFERGMIGHFEPFLFEPLLHIPLMIFEPGQSQRRDVYTRTSAVDVLPTLLSVTGQPIPSGIEGEILPPYRQAPVDEDRPIYAFEAKKSSQFKPTTKGTASIIKGDYKLVYYYGYERLNKGPIFDLINLKDDPNEINNLYHQERNIADQLRQELELLIEEADAPYRS